MGLILNASAHVVSFVVVDLTVVEVDNSVLNAHPTALQQALAFLRLVHRGPWIKGKKASTHPLHTQRGTVSSKGAMDEISGKWQAGARLTHCTHHTSTQ